jgi:hypothetical protein
MIPLSHILLRVLRVILTYSPMVVGEILLNLVFRGKKIDLVVALAVYGAEVQVFAIFATLTPIFFMFTQFYKPDKHFLRELTGAAVAVVTLSIIGIGLCVFSMVTQNFDGVTVLFPFIVVVEMAIIISLALFAYSGYERAQKWLRND